MTAAPIRNYVLTSNGVELARGWLSEVRYVRTVLENMPDKPEDACYVISPATSCAGDRAGVEAPPPPCLTPAHA